MNKKVWIAFYDITDGHRINKVAKLLLSCMVRIQKSVFMGHLDDNMVYSLYKNVITILSDDDRFLICPICKDDINGIRTIGRSLLRLDEDLYKIL